MKAYHPGGPHSLQSSQPTASQIKSTMYDNQKYNSSADHQAASKLDYMQKQLTSYYRVTLKMTSAQDVEMSVTNKNTWMTGFHQVETLSTLRYLRQVNFKSAN